MSATFTEAGSWNTLEPKLSLFTLETLETLGFSKMTPVQASTIPLFMKNKDVMVEAVTGSGKTLAFVIPIIEKLVYRKKRLASNEIDPSLPKHALIIGGVTTLQDDITEFKELGPDILIGTPGRLQDLIIGRGNAKSVVNTKELEILVLDEADRLLDMGFSQTLNNIIAHLPKQRRTGLFSATITDAISEIVRAGLRNPVRVVVRVQDIISKDELRTPATLDIGYIVCEPHQKLIQLIRIINQEAIAKKYIVYFATCACVDYFYKILSRVQQLKGASIHSLHGQMDTKRRTATYHSFLNTPTTSKALLLCTDVAARGLDMPDVDYVIQMDPPQDPKVFSHRCGRTARAGKEGKAIVLLVRGREEVYVDFLKIRKIPLRQLSYVLPDSITTQDPVVDEENEVLLKQVRDIILTDRDLHDKGIKAFVSYVRSYTKHDASYIFRLKDLNLGKVAKGYGLLRLPKMPELKDYKSDDFEETPINMDEYKYADKSREKQRRQKLTEAKLKSATQSDKRHKRQLLPKVEDPRLRLRRAACEGNLDLIKRLLKKTNMQNPDPENGWTTLMYATRCRHEYVVEYLLQLGHDELEPSRDFENNTILMVAAEYNALEILKIYTKYYPHSVNMVNKQGQTALIIASKLGNLDAIKLLLEIGAEVNQADFDGNTALHYSAAWNHFQVVTMLIERGCQFASKNKSGWTALDYSYSMELKAHLQECARAYHEETKNSRRRNLKISVDSMISLDSIPITTRSATFPPVKELILDNGNQGNRSYSNGSLSPNDFNPMNQMKRKESLPW
ncbi:2039_t:CDS:10 [Funneliformis mosseae]|uniref:ATP-dependent RNA helicase n=1 Tax=Funneliformis mosseae TaxID=27381 RepID=A0A9N9GZH1_FUNMO|nr:2039_t:CDS:10 [Funneliformis mosseae]